MTRSTPRTGLILARAAALIGVLVLICVPALTRIGQKLETASRAPSFSRNIECPPKKVAVAPAQAILAATAADFFEAAPLVCLIPAATTAPPPSLFRAPAQPLRAPPSAFLS